MVKLNKFCLSTRGNSIWSISVRQNNWPPLPQGCCFQPCFYQDIYVDIPLEFQKVVRMLYYIWLCMLHSSVKFHTRANLNPVCRPRRSPLAECAGWSHATLLRRQICYFLPVHLLRFPVHSSLFPVLVPSGLQSLQVCLRLACVNGVWQKFFFLVAGTTVRSTSWFTSSCTFSNSWSPCRTRLDSQVAEHGKSIWKFVGEFFSNWIVFTVVS